MTLGQRLWRRICREGRRSHKSAFILDEEDRCHVLENVAYPKCTIIHLSETNICIKMVAAALFVSTKVIN